MDDVHTLYDSTDIAEKKGLLLKYDVRYVIVGDVERYWLFGAEPYASPAGLAAFDRMVGTTLEVAVSIGDDHGLPGDIEPVRGGSV